jgi:hypothetical protein
VAFPTATFSGQSSSGESQNDRKLGKEPWPRDNFNPSAHW